MKLDEMFQEIAYLLEVPLDVSGDDRLDSGVDGSSVLTVDLDLVHHGELDSVLLSSKGLDARADLRLLSTELVARESNDAETTIHQLSVELAKSVVLRRWVKRVRNELAIYSE